MGWELLLLLFFYIEVNHISSMSAIFMFIGIDYLLDRALRGTCANEDRLVVP